MVERHPSIDPYLGESIQIKPQTEERQIWGSDNIYSEKMPIHYELETLHVTGREKHRSTFICTGKLLKQPLMKSGEPLEEEQFYETRRDDLYIIWDPGPKLMQQPDTHGGGHYLNGSIKLEFLRHKGQQLCAETLREQEVSGVLMCLGHYNVQEKDSYQSCPKGMKPGHSLDQQYVNSLLNMQEKIRTLRPNLDQKKLQDQFDRTPLHKQNFQPRFGSQIWPLHRLGLIPFDPGIHVKLQGWKIEWQQRLTSGGELKRMQLESHKNRQTMIMHSQGMEQMKVPKPELEHMNEADINALKAKKVKRPTIAPTLKEVPHLSLALFVLISIGIDLAISHMASKFGEYPTKHGLNRIREGNDSHQALPWALDQVLVRTIRNFKEPFFETTQDGLGTDSIKVKGPTINSPDELLHKVNMKSTLKDNCTIRKKWILLTPDRQFKVIDELSREVDMPCNDLEDKVKLEGAGIDGTHSITQLAFLSVFINGQNQRSNASLAQIFGIDKMDYMKAKEASGGPKDLTQEEGRPGHVFEFKIQNIIIQMEYKGQPLLLIKSENLGH